MGLHLAILVATSTTGRCERVVTWAEDEAGLTACRGWQRTVALQTWIDLGLR
jgi:hypothetical protein